MRLLTVAALLLAASSAQAANLYKCEVDGHTTYSDRPCDVPAGPRGARHNDSEQDPAARAVRVVSRLQALREGSFAEASISDPAGHAGGFPR